MKLDLLATGTAQREEGDKDERGTPGLTEQPFPPAPVRSSWSTSPMAAP